MPLLYSSPDVIVLGLIFHNNQLNQLFGVGFVVWKRASLVALVGEALVLSGVAKITLVVVAAVKKRSRLAILLTHIGRLFRVN